jgi:uncharacterized protein (DUF433 family)
MHLSTPRPVRYAKPVSQVTAAAERIPLIADPKGVLRIVGTEITLDRVVGLYEAGITAEDIARLCRPVLLADIYAVLTFYLRHQDEIDADIKRRIDAEAGRRRTVEDMRVEREEPPVFPGAATVYRRSTLDPGEAARERSDLLARKHRGQQLSTSEEARLEGLTARLRAQLSPFSIRDLESLLEMTEEVSLIRERARERRQRRV